MLTQYALLKDQVFTLSYDQISKNGLLPKYAEEANKLLLQEEEETRKLIEAGKDKVQRLADTLEEKSHMNTEEIKAILGKSSETESGT